jgi:hypothetical protein
MEAGALLVGGEPADLGASAQRGCGQRALSAASRPATWFAPRLWRLSGLFVLLEAIMTSARRSMRTRTRVLSASKMPISRVEATIYQLTKIGGFISKWAARALAMSASAYEAVRLTQGMALSALLWLAEHLQHIEAEYQCEL